MVWGKSVCMPACIGKYVSTPLDSFILVIFGRVAALVNNGVLPFYQAHGRLSTLLSPTTAENSAEPRTIRRRFISPSTTSITGINSNHNKLTASLNVSTRLCRTSFSVLPSRNTTVKALKHCGRILING